MADGDLTGQPRRRRPLVGRIRGLRRHGDVLLVGTIEGRVYAVDAGSLSP